MQNLDRKSQPSLRSRRFTSQPNYEFYDFREFGFQANVSAKKPRIAFMQSGSQEIITEGSIYRNEASKPYETQATMNQE